MFLKFSSGSGLQLEDRDNFRAFKLVVEGQQSELDSIRSALTGNAELVDAAQPGYLRTPYAAGRASSTTRLGSRIFPP